jgi:hypothetical protein
MTRASVDVLAGRVDVAERGQYVGITPETYSMGSASKAANIGYCGRDNSA